MNEQTAFSKDVDKNGFLSQFLYKDYLITSKALNDEQSVWRVFKTKDHKNIDSDTGLKLIVTNDNQDSKVYFYYRVIGYVYGDMLYLGTEKIKVCKNITNVETDFLRNSLPDLFVTDCVIKCINELL